MPTPPSSEQLTVLLVDDDPEFRAALAGALSDEGVQVHQTGNGQQALEWLHANPERRPHVIVLDLMMPIMNGWQFRETQKNDGALCTIPVVVMTATHELGPVDADRVLHKPAHLEDVLQAVLGAAAR